jgi:DNA-binding beta-propeller fold protein YncE
MRLLLVATGVVAFMGCFPVANAADAHTPIPGYSIIARIPGPGTDWDYLSVDAAARRLYIAHSGVTALDLNTNTVSANIVAGKMTHGVLPLGGGVVAVDDSTDHSLTIFDGATGKVRVKLEIPRSSTKKGFHDPDYLAIEPTTGLLAVVNGDSGELVLVDPSKPSVVGEIPIAGDLESAVADGRGSLYVNVASSNEIAVVHVATKKVSAHFPLKKCEEPTGLAFDAKDDLLIAACDNGIVKFIDAESGRDIKTFKVGKGPDAVIFDAARNLAFIPSGDTGTLSVIAVHGARDIALAETVPTQRGARTGALDPQTGRLYLPTAKFNPPTSEFPFPRAIEGTFEILVVAPR